MDSFVSFFMEIAQDIDRQFPAVFHKAMADEDYLVGAQIQKSSLSKQMDLVKFSRNEPGLQHVHNGFREALGMPLVQTYARLEPSNHIFAFGTNAQPR